MATPIRYGSEFVVNRTTTGNQETADITALSNGRFAVTWVDRYSTAPDVYQDDVRAQVFGADGRFVGPEVLVNTTTLFRQLNPEIVALQNGGFAVAFDDLSQTGGDTSSSSVRLQRFTQNSLSTGLEVLVNTTTLGSQLQPDVTQLRNGSMLVVWSQSEQGSGFFGYSVLNGQIFNADGSRSGREYRIADDEENSLSDAAMALLSDGRGLVTWSHYEISPLGKGIFSIHARILGPNGRPMGDDFVVAAPISVPAPGGIALFFPEVTALKSGGFVITYNDFFGGVENLRNNDAIVKVFDASGVELTTINATSQNDDDQYNPVVTALADGRFIVAWTERTARPGDDDYSVRAQVFNANGTRSDAEFLVNTTTTNWQFDPTITTLADGRVVISWTDFSGTGDDTSGFAIRAQIFDPHEAAVVLNGTTDGDELVGTRFADTIRGGGGRDSLAGGQGNDVIQGEGSHDRLSGGAGNDTITGGIGSDRLTGSLGADVFVFGPRDGHDRVTDFANGIDRIDLRSFGFANAAAALAHFAQDGANTAFTVGAAELTLINFASGQIDASDLLI